MTYLAYCILTPVYLSCVKVFISLDKLPAQVDCGLICYSSQFSFLYF